MPTKRTTSNALSSVSQTPKRNEKQPEPEWGGFLDIRLTEKDKDAFTAWRVAFSGEYWDWAIGTVKQGFKMSLSLDVNNDCYVAAFTGAGVSHDPRRYSLTARSSDLNEAVAMLVFKHMVLLEGEWGNYKPSQHYTRSWG